MTDTDLNHRVSATELTRSVIEGVRVEALCGEPVLCKHRGAEAMPGCETGSTQLDMCPDCDELFEICRQRDVLTKRFRQRKAQLDQARHDRQLLDELDRQLLEVTA